MCGDGEGDCSRDSDCSGSLVRFTFTLVLNFHFSTILVFGVVGEIHFYFLSKLSLLYNTCFWGRFTFTLVRSTQHNTFGSLVIFTFATSEHFWIFCTILLLWYG